MDITEIHPELRKAFRRTPSLPFHNKWFVAIANLLLKLRRSPSEISGVKIEEKSGHGASVRVYTPPVPQSGAALLWIHGGGLLVGRASMNDALCAQYARDLNLIVVSVNYRLANKHPYPAAIDDCFNAWLWLQQFSASLGVNPERIVVSGQSAGGGLAASLVQKIADECNTQPAGQALLCPMLDDRTAAMEELDAIKHKMWNNRNNRTGWTAYLAQPVGQAVTPTYAVAGRRESLTGLPPAWIGIGSIDLFYEDSKNYAERLNRADVNCEFYAVPGAPHAFELLAPDASVTKEFFDSNYNFLRQTLNLSSNAGSVE